jgi:hypothetical protein
MKARQTFGMLVITDKFGGRNLPEDFNPYPANVENMVRS